MSNIRKEVRGKIFQAVKEIADTVGCTMGYNGRTVEYFPTANSSVSTTDGVTVADKVFGSNPEEQVGFEKVKEAAKEVRDRAGDGTTTTSVLIGSLVTNVEPHLVSKKNSPFSIKRGMDIAYNLAEKELKRKSKKLTKKDIKNIATVSVHGDEDLGKLIAEAYDKVGKYGHVSFEESYILDHVQLDVHEGSFFPNGMLNREFYTDKHKKEFRAEEAHLLLCSTTLTDSRELHYAVSKLDKPCILVTPSLSAEVATKIATYNKINPRKMVIPIQTNSGSFEGAAIIAQRDLDILNDFADLFGAKVVQGSGMYPIEDWPDHIFESSGIVKDVIIGDGYSIFGGGVRNEKAIESIYNLMKVKGNSKERIDFLNIRLQLLKGVTARIRVGAFTEAERKEIFTRVEDAVKAVESAEKEGFLPGGGVSLFRLKEHLELSKPTYLNDSESIGYDVVVQSLDAPMKRILENGGVDFVSVVPKILNEDYPFGFNMKTRQVENLITSGIIDPTFVVLSALKASLACTGILMNIERIIEGLEYKLLDGSSNHINRGHASFG